MNGWPGGGRAATGSSRSASTRCGPGCYDPHERVKDMDLGGIWAAVNFPSMITGFCGRVYSAAQDPELGLAVTRAYNDWMYEEWWQQHPERFIPLGITYLADAEKAAAEIDRNAERGFVAVTSPSGRTRSASRRSSTIMGSGHARVRGDRDRDLPPRRLLGSRRHRARCSAGARARSSDSSRSRRARSGCGRAGR